MLQRYNIMAKKTAEEIAAEKASAKKAKLAKQIVDLSTFKKRDAKKWEEKPRRPRIQDASGTRIVGLKGLGQTTKIKKTRAYKPKTREA